MKKLKLRVFSRDISASPMMSKLDSVMDVLFGIFKKNRLRRNLKCTTSLISLWNLPKLQLNTLTHTIPHTIYKPNFSPKH